MDKEKIKALEETYAKREIPVVSNNSAHRFTPDVPMVIPEINADHLEAIAAQKKRLGTARGLYRGEIQLLAAILRPLAAPLEKIRDRTGRSLHLSGDFRRGKDVCDHARDRR